MILCSAGCFVEMGPDLLRDFLVCFSRCLPGGRHHRGACHCQRPTPWHRQMHPVPCPQCLRTSEGEAKGKEWLAGEPGDGRRSRFHFSAGSPGTVDSDDPRPPRSQETNQLASTPITATGARAAGEDKIMMLEKGGDAISILVLADEGGISLLSFCPGDIEEYFVPDGQYDPAMAAGEILNLPAAVAAESD